MAREIFPISSMPACFALISMAYGCTSACFGRDGISCSFSVARCFLFGFRLWVLLDRTAPNRAVGEGFWPSQRYAKYVLHVVFRVAFHLQTFPSTMWNGLCWWLDQWRLSAPRT